MDTQAQANLHSAGNVPKTWMWKPWAALAVVFILAVGYHYVFRPDLELSLPTLSFHDGICTATFYATNHTGHQTTAVLHVILGTNRLGDDNTPPNCIYNPT